MAIKVKMRCDKCRRINYSTYKTKNQNSKLLQLQKFCPICLESCRHSETF